MEMATGRLAPGLMGMIFFGLHGGVHGGARVMCACAWASAGVLRRACACAWACEHVYVFAAHQPPNLASQASSITRTRSTRLEDWHPPPPPQLRALSHLLLTRHPPSPTLSPPSTHSPTHPPTTSTATHLVIQASSIMPTRSTRLEDWREGWLAALACRDILSLELGACAAGRGAGRGQGCYGVCGQGLAGASSVSTRTHTCLHV